MLQLYCVKFAVKPSEVYAEHQLILQSELDK